MDIKLKHLLPILGVLSSQLFATPQSIREEGKVITPSANPKMNWAVDPFVMAEFVYWQIGQMGLEYMRSGERAQTDILITKDGKAGTPQFEWCPGFKIGLGAHLGHDNWDTLVRYTWLYSSAHDTVRDPTGNTTVRDGIAGAIQRPGGRFLGPTKGSISWNIHFNVLDWEFGRAFYLSKFLAVRPYGGLKGMWQKTESRSIISFVPPLPSDSILEWDGEEVSGPIYTTKKEYVWGIGPRMGLETRWYLFQHWSLVSNIAFSGLWNNPRERFKIATFDNETQVAVGSYNKNSPNNQIAIVAEFQLGASYEWWINQDAWRFALETVYENQVWFQFDSNTGDQVLHGLTAKLRFDF